MALEVEIALQGGGARLYALLAAMKAVEDLETNGEIKVTKIAGTSAGAIAATLYAARVPMKNALNEFDTLDFDKVLKPVEQKRRVKSALAGLFSWIFVKLSLNRSQQEFLVRNRVRLRNVLLGSAIYTTKGLEDTINNIIIKHSKLKDRFGDDFRTVTFKTLERYGAIKLIVLRTDLRIESLGSSDTKENQDANILPFVIDSAAIPFVFRNIKDENFDRLDGGICANLPAYFLFGRHRIAVGFSDEMKDIGKGWLKLTALLDASINYSVERSTKEVRGLHYVRIGTNIKSFDFASIIGPTRKQFRDDEKAGVTKFVQSELTHIVRSAKVTDLLGGDPWKIAYEDVGSTASVLREALLDMYNVTPVKFPVSEIRQHVLLYLKEGETENFDVEVFDERTIAPVFERGDSRRYYLKLNIAGPENMDMSRYEVRAYVGDDEQGIHVRSAPCLRNDVVYTKEGPFVRTRLLDLTELVKASSGINGTPMPIRVLSYTKAGGLVKKLFDQGPDGGEPFGYHFVDCSAKVASVEISVSLPETYMDDADYKRLTSPGLVYEKRCSDLQETVDYPDSFRKRCSKLRGTADGPSGFGEFRYRAMAVAISSELVVGFKLSLQAGARTSFDGKPACS